MGKVYRVEDKKIEGEVALKLIKPEIAADKKTIDRFRSELKTARMISQRNVCRMFDLDESEGMHYITMEYVPGEDLKSFLRRSKKLTVETAISIAKQVCDGLEEAHSMGVVHRDLKPSNIMIDMDGNARIMDFGIARSLKAKGLTDAGVMIGTPEYMSPEQVEAKTVDHGSDIYSLGVILYEMVTGRVPFDGDTPLSIAYKQKNEAPLDPKTINPQIPADLCYLILKCLEKEEDKRYQSAGEVRTELENIEKGIPTTEETIKKRKPITSKEITVTFRLKRLVLPALVLIGVITIGVVLWQFLSQQETALSPFEESSIAVLPFEDLSPEKDQEYLCEGIAESLINALTKVKDLRVPARTSSFSFKGKEQNIQEIAEQLKVSAVLEGSVQKAGNRIRITAQLINVSDESLLWSEQYNRDLNDIFAIQDEITFAIVEKLKLNLYGGGTIEISKHYTKNPEAHDAYLKGRYLWNKRGNESIFQALDYFELAAKLDPTYALAYAGLADTYHLLGERFVLAPIEAFPKAKENALKALKLNPNLAEAHTALAIIKYEFDWDWEGAEKGFKHVFNINDNYAIAHQWYAEYLSAMGRFDESLSEIRRAQELDPLSLIIHAVEAWILYYARDYDRAIEKCLKTLEMDPNFSNARYYLGLVYKEKGMYEEALKLWPQDGLTYAKMGNISEAKKRLAEMIEQSKITPVRKSSIALLCFELGEIDQGFEWLEKAYEERDTVMIRLKVSPQFNKVRSDPRFKAMLKKMNLE